MNGNNKFSFGYEDTDKKVEIELYGLTFEIKNLENIKELENIDQSDKNNIEAQLENILGEGAVDKINKKRNNDGYKELSLNNELSIFGFIFETYAKSISNSVLGKVVDTVNDIGKQVDDIGQINRQQRRNYNRNNYRKNNYRGNNNYRRY